MNNSDDIARSRRVRIIELTRVHHALLAIESAITGLECSDFGAQDGISAWILHTAHNVGDIVKELEGEEDAPA